MEYQELLRVAAGDRAGDDSIDKDIKRLLSPAPLKEPEDLEKIISARFRYTGPGKMDEDSSAGRKSRFFLRKIILKIIFCFIPVVLLL